MVIATETFRQSDIHIDGGGNFADPQAFIAFLTAQINADAASKWVESATDPLYLELKPDPAGNAINKDDRILVYGGVIPSISALGINGVANPSYMYICFAPGAGTLGPDNNPSLGNPYTGVLSSKLVVANAIGVGFEDRFYIVETENKWFMGMVEITAGLQERLYPFYAGRGLINVAGDALDPIVITSPAEINTNFLGALGVNSNQEFVTSGTLPHTATNARFEHFNGTIWEQVARDNAQHKDAGSDVTGTKFWYRDITCRDGADNFAGTLHQFRMGYTETAYTIINDGQGNFAYAIGRELNVAGNSTGYFMDV